MDKISNTLTIISSTIVLKNLFISNRLKYNLNNPINEIKINSNDPCTIKTKNISCLHRTASLRSCSTTMQVTSYNCCDFFHSNSKKKSQDKNISAKKTVIYRIKCCIRYLMTLNGCAIPLHTNIVVAVPMPSLLTKIGLISNISSPKGGTRLQYTSDLLRHTS